MSFRGSTWPCVGDEERRLEPRSRSFPKTCLTKLVWTAARRSLRMALLSEQNSIPLPDRGPRTNAVDGSREATAVAGRKDRKARSEPFGRRPDNRIREPERSPTSRLRLGQSVGEESVDPARGTPSLGHLVEARSSRSGTADERIATTTRPQPTHLGQGSDGGELHPGDADRFDGPAVIGNRIEINRSGYRRRGGVTAAASRPEKRRIAAGHNNCRGRSRDGKEVA